MDLRKRKSQQKLQDALAEHLKVKALEEITIGELTESAGVSRQTFYSNFDSKQAVLVGRIERILISVSEYFGPISSRQDLSRHEIIELGVKHLLETCEQHRTLTTAAFTGHIQHRVLLEFKHSFQPTELDIMADFYAGAFMGMIQGYLSSPPGSKSIDAIAKEVSILMPLGIDGILAKEV